MKLNYDLNSSDRNNYNSLPNNFSIPENDIIDSEKANAALGKITRAAAVAKAIPILVIGFLILALPLVIKGFMGNQNKNCSVEAEGYVTEFDVWETENGIFYAPVVRFTAEDGKQYESTYASYSADKICAENSTINILYDPDDPSRIVLPDYKKSEAFSDIIFMLPGIILLIMGISMLKKAKGLKDYTT